MKINPVLKILLENAKTFSERNEITGLMESEMNSVTSAMVSNLYKSAIEKSYINFENIPESKGDLTRYEGYKSMVGSIALLKELCKKHNVKIAELETVETAMNNIITYRDAFEKGFKLEKEFIMLQYNILVYACVEALSVIISSYVDFVKRPDRVEFVLNKNPRHHHGFLLMKNLEFFNMAVKKGEFSKVLNGVINSGKEGFTGAESILIPAFIIGAVASIVPLIRELIFVFYYSRMKLSDYLEHQATFLEINKQNIQASNLPAKQKNEIIKKQTKYIEKLRRISESIKVDGTMSENKATIELNKENKAWTINDVKSQAASMDTTGFQLL